MVQLFRWVGLSLLLGLALPAQGQETQRQAYFAFDPDITTNFVKVGDSRRLGYLRVSVEAVTRSVEDLSLVEHHAPLLRDAFIQIFGQAQEGKVRSLTGREELRQECLERAQELLSRETGREVVKDIIFTTYLYQ